MSRKRDKGRGEQVVSMPVYLSEEDHKGLHIAPIEEGRAGTDIIWGLVKEWPATRKKKRGS